MAEPQAVTPVKLFAAMLWADVESRDESLRRMTAAWGSIDFQGSDRPFDATDYYVPEMGGPLTRRLVAFELLAPPESLAAAKLTCNEIERGLAGPRGRRVNLDIGYLDHHKVVLASLKYAGQKIHLAHGVYADLVSRFRDGAYQPFDWTFPDFRDGRYQEELLAMRQAYLRQLRELRRAP